MDFSVGCGKVTAYPIRRITMFLSAKRTVASILLALLVIGCGGNGVTIGGNQNNMTVPEVVQGFWTAWGKHDVSGTMSFVSKEYFESGLSYEGLKHQISISGKFGVSDFVASNIVNTGPDRCTVDISFTMTNDAGSGTTTATMTLSKQALKWLICGDRGK